MKVAMGYPMKAEEAFRFGLAQSLASHNELLTQTTAVAERFAELKPPRRLARAAPS